ncbi:flagellar brake protein YcgR [mine drainage metagenome]|uniref:Flagellar brake protein YcgR n=1 Tax=mine drainage metagenome TaxID=410659 RepID=A0A1J5QRQ9_9ZZZZ
MNSRMAEPTENQARQPAAEEATPRKSALDVEDDYSKYEVHSQTEVISILRGMMQQGSLITFYFNQGYDFLLTSLIDISADGRTLIFDYGSNMEMNRRALQVDKINCVSSKEKVKIQFVLHGVDPVKFEGRDAFLGDVPASLVRLQRREFYRMSMPVANPIKCQIPILQQDGSIRKAEAVLVDISGGGVGLTVPPDEGIFKVGAEFANVSINLPNVGLISATLRVRNLYDVTMPSGKIHQRAGCQFLKLPGPMMTLIQRYIIQVERERKSREI